MSERITAITMPKWGMAMDEGTVVVWHVAEGASVAESQEVVDVESPKIANAIEAKRAGVLRRQVAPLGSVLPVGGLIGVIADADVTDPEIDAFVAGYEPPEAALSDSGPSIATVEANGRTIAYLDIGAGDPPIVMVHGFGGSLASFMFNQSSLAEDRRVIAIDLPGHGASSKDVGDGSALSLADAIAAAIDVIGLTRFHLVGHSLGGAVCLHLAELRPAQVASVTLIASAGLGPEIDGAFIDAFVAAERRKEMTDVATKLYADESIVTRRVVEDMLRMKRIDGASKAMATIATQQFPGGRQSAAAPTDSGVPLLVIWGEADRVIPVAHAALASGAQRHIVAGAGHMVHAEAHAEVSRAIAEFCNAHP
ncbi:MAG: acetoin dehydrogenase dihydrolipoyllysine-residue acetyltransferase subunit [Rhodospirillaceae bacterium]|nr:acetoin dehydrogenase dihydrolipoyllysine-residue acetyltransferase subunit [Rhodospirillaceae bacterium]